MTDHPTTLPKVQLPQIGAPVDTIIKDELRIRLCNIIARATDGDLHELHHALVFIKGTNRRYYDSMQSSPLIRSVFTIVTDEYNSRVDVMNSFRPVLKL